MTLVGVLPYGMDGSWAGGRLLGLRRWGRWFKRSPTTAFGDDMLGEFGDDKVGEFGDDKVGEFGDDKVGGIRG